MSKAKKGKKQVSTFIELIGQTRGSWYGVNPVTKTVPAKKGKGSFKRKPKHPKQLED